jgi:hypothetical protein
MTHDFSNPALQATAARRAAGCSMEIRTSFCRRRPAPAAVRELGRYAAKTRVWQMTTYLKLVGVFLWALSSQAVTPLLPATEQEVMRSLLADPQAFVRTREIAVLQAVGASNLDLTSLVIKQSQYFPLTNAVDFSEAVQDLLRKQGQARLIAELGNTPRPVRLVQEDKFTKMFSDQDDSFDDWLAFCEQFPDCTWITALSRVGFSSKGTAAIVFYALEQPSRPAIPGFYLLRRDQGRWAITEVRRAMNREAPDAVVTCGLRFYVVNDYPAVDSPRLILKVEYSSETNLACSVPQSYKLIHDGEALRDLTGWVLQVTEPPEYAGQLVTALRDDWWSAAMFRFGRLYVVALPREMIGTHDFRVRF